MSESWRSRRNWQVFALLLAGFVIRLLVVMAQGNTLTLHSDDQGYLLTAEVWVQKGLYTYGNPTIPTVFITPGFPALIALVQWCTRNVELTANIVRVIQALIWMSMSWILIRLFRQWFSKSDERSDSSSAEVFFAAFLSLYPPFLLITSLILTESLFTLFFVLLCVSGYRLLQQFSWRQVIWFSLWWVLAAYVRPTIALFPVFFFLWVWRRHGLPLRTVVKGVLLSGLIFSLCFSPWWVRNWHEFHRFIPLSLSSGDPMLQGTYTPFEKPSLLQRSQWIIQHGHDDKVTYDAWATAEAKHRFIDQMKTAPFTYLLFYVVYKFLRFWGWVFWWKPILPISYPVMGVLHYVVLISGIAGAWLTRRTLLTKFFLFVMLYFTVLHQFFLPNERYALPLFPLLGFWTSLSFVKVKRHLQRRFAKMVGDH
ncbi:MAG: putative rane protein [Bacilli bacterium]|nr:putative rane protein [Bacilli bacterium]